MNTIKKEGYEQVFVTKKLLQSIADEGRRIGFNRQIDPAMLGRIRNDNMLVQLLMHHHYIGGQPAPEHCRCFLTFRTCFGGDLHHAIIDMTKERYQDLPFWSMPKIDSERPSSRLVPLAAETPCDSGKDTSMPTLLYV